MHLSPKTPEFWNQVPADYLRPLVIDSEKAGVPLTFFAMGDPEDPETPAFAVFKMGPGEVLPRHSHDCKRFEVIIQGSMVVHSPDEPEQELEVGDVMLAEPNEMYGPHVAGPDGFTVVEYFSRIAAVYEITFDTKRGPWERNLLEDAKARFQRRSQAQEINR